MLKFINKILSHFGYKIFSLKEYEKLIQSYTDKIELNNEDTFVNLFEY